MKWNTNFKDLGISKQILIVSIGLSVTLVIFLLSFSSTELVKSKNAEKSTTAKNRSVAVIEKIDRNFYERFGDVQAFAYNKLALQTIDTGRATAEAQQFINTMVSYYVLYDLMMIVDNSGKVLAVNSEDKLGGPLNSSSLIGEDFSREDWFRRCMSPTGPEGGAWYSDFMVNPYVAKIYGSKGWGMAFAAPIKDAKGKNVGVWYNFASWKDVTQGIRSETEQLLKEKDAGIFVVVTDKAGKVIDAEDEDLVLNFQFDEGIQNRSVDIATKRGVVNSEDYIIGFAQGKGAYTYKGNQWKVVCFIPKEDFSFSIIFGELSLLTGLTLLILFLGVLAFMLLANNISKKIKDLQKIIYQVSLGDLVDVRESRRKDETGQMTNSVKALADGLKRTSQFANEIGNGNLSVQHQPMSDKDVLGHSLVSMRENLLKVKVEDEKRKWVAQGLADFGDRLRANNASLEELCDNVVSFLCDYLEANQAAIFMEDAKAKNNLQLVACYAWKKKKHVTINVNEDEGLVSQAWKEGSPIFLTHVPANFVKITSGLGQATPRSVLLLPLKNNDEVLGVLEIASLNVFEEHEIEYLKKACDSLAATLASSKISERTRILLEQSQAQAEALQGQEEELRQNVEEMKSIQEEMMRREQDYVNKIRRLEELTRNVA